MVEGPTSASNAGRGPRRGTAHNTFSFTREPVRRSLSLIISLLLILASLPLTAGVATATTNQPDWIPLSPGASPGGRQDASMAFDPATGQLVLFGGSNNSPLGDTWVWDGSTWTQLSPAASPSARVAANLAFDPATGQLVLFGGSNNVQLGDTWTWDGSTWTQLSPAASPAARQDASLAFDPATGQLLLFGGYNGNYLNDTWTWDGTNWTQLSPGTSPSSRYGADLAFDTATGQLLLFGGFGGGSHNDTWTWDGTNWTQLNPSTSPSSRYGADLAFDTATGKLLLFGGFDGNYLNDTWTWDGTNWTQLSSSTIPAGRRMASLAFDPATGQFLLFGGFNVNLGNFNDTWIYGVPTFGTNWAQLSPGTSPPTGSDTSMAYDPATGQLLLFGGIDSTSSVNDTWTWDGTNWIQLSPRTSPPVRGDASLAYDPATGQLILFGGDNVGGYLNDTWVWNGSNWTQLSPATSPPTRNSASMAFDPATGQLLLFGGSNVSQLNDTWNWDGTNWTQLSPSTSPSARNGASMTYDPATGQFLLFGGESINGYDNNTWAWNGSTWTQLSPGTSPSRRYRATMAFDPAAGQPILFGGYGLGGVIGETWTWTGSTWTQLNPNTSPSGRWLASMAFDPATGQFILFGGDTENDTWELAPVLDTTAPTTSATGANADTSAYTFGSWTNQTVTVTLAASDTQSGVAATYYTIDTGSQQTYSAPFDVSGSGTHTVTYWSTDNVGNVETSNSVTVMIETTAPVTSASAANADTSTYTFGSWTNQAVTVTLSVTDSGGSSVAGTFYTIDGGSQQAYTTPFTISSEGDHTVDYWSTDTAGNEETHNTVHVMIDTTAPDTSASATNADTSPYTFSNWTNQTVTVTLSASDGGGSDISGTFYTIDEGSQTTYSSPFTISSQGDHTVIYWSTDTAGNVETGHEVHVMIDTTQPMVTYSGNLGTYSVDQTVDITCTATDTLSGVASTSCQNISGPAYSFALGLNTFNTSATDNAGNVGTGSTSFTVTESSASLCSLTSQFETNRLTATWLCLSLNGIDAAPLPVVKAFYLNMYVTSVNQDRTLTPQQKSILINLARALAGRK